MGDLAAARQCYERAYSMLIKLLARLYDPTEGYMILTLGAFHVLFWLGAIVLWQAAVRRLEGWERGGLPANA
jgi:hypothetical protein